MSMKKNIKPEPDENRTEGTDRQPDMILMRDGEDQGEPDTILVEHTPARIPRDSLRVRVAKMLAAERMMQRISQAELAAAMHTSKSSISRFESGRQNMTVDYVQAMGDVLNKNVSFVMEDHKIEYGDSAEYSLKLYDEELIRFRMSRGIDLKVKILSVKENRKEVFPLDLELTDEGLKTWLRKRIVPKNREYVGSILRSLGLTMDDLKGILDVCLGLSLNDSYWTPQTTFEGS